MSATGGAVLKRLEVAWRTIWIRVLTRLMRRDPAPAPPNWGAHPHRVLFLRHDRIGDMILSTGLLRVIAASYATIKLEVLASPANAPVLREDPHIERVVVFDRSKPSRYVAALRLLRRTKYDAVIDCMPTAPSLTTLLLMWASGATHRIGIAGRGNDAALTIPVQPNRAAAHIVDQLAPLASPFGVDVDRTSFHPRIYLNERERDRATATWESSAGRSGRRLLVNISVGRAFRRWPDDRYTAAIKHVLSRDSRVEVVIIAAPDDRARAEAIAADSSGRFAPTPSVRDAFALVATADVLFTPDTGVAHAASAFQRPALVMHIGGTAKQWGLYQSPGAELSSSDGSLASLQLEPVLDALDRLLADEVSVRSRAAIDGELGHFVR